MTVRLSREESDVVGNFEEGIPEVGNLRQKGSFVVLKSSVVDVEERSDTELYHEIRTPLRGQCCLPGSFGP